MKYNKKTTGIIFKSLAECKSKSESAKISGINMKTFYHWMNTYPEFKSSVEEILMVRLEQEKEDAIDAIKKAYTNGIWTAAAWFLERRFPEEYALRKQQMELTGTIEHKQLSINVMDIETKQIMENVIEIIDKKNDMKN